MYRAVVHKHPERVSKHPDGPSRDASSCIWRRWLTASRLLLAVQHHVGIPATRRGSCVLLGKSAMNSSLLRTNQKTENGKRRRKRRVSQQFPPQRAPASSRVTPPCCSRALTGSGSPRGLQAIVSTACRLHSLAGWLCSWMLFTAAVKNLLALRNEQDGRLDAAGREADRGPAGLMLFWMGENLAYRSHRMRAYSCVLRRNQPEAVFSYPAVAGLMVSFLVCLVSSLFLFHSPLLLAVFSLSTCLLMKRSLARQRITQYLFPIAWCMCVTGLESTHTHTHTVHSLIKRTRIQPTPSHILFLLLVLSFLSSTQESVQRLRPLLG